MIEFMAFFILEKYYKNNYWLLFFIRFVLSLKKNKND